MYVREVDGVVDVITRAGFLRREGNEVDGQIRGTFGVNLKGRVPRGAMTGCSVGEFLSR